MCPIKTEKETMPTIPLTEPMSARYIYINPETNQVHLLVPIVQGQEISTDNTCKSTEALKDFEKSVLNELNKYKSAVEFDLQLLEASSLQKESKEEDSPTLKACKEARLTQINAYTKALPSMQNKYSAAIASMMSVPSNLYSIQLRPHDQDTYSRVINPVFSIERSNDAQGNPKSALYNAIYATYPNITPALLDPKSTLDAAVLKALAGASISFAAIQTEMTTQCNRLFNIPVDFTRDIKNNPVSQASIDTLMGFSNVAPATTQDYIDALWGICAPNLGASIPTPPFNSVLNDQDKTEKLSILTQFFLAHVNIYCAARNISDKNFGVMLDASPELSNELVAIVFSALGAGSSAEESLLEFFNDHAQDFGLNKTLTQTDMNAIQQKFNSTYKTVTATKENPHMDDFMILDVDRDTRAGQFVTHQGSICTGFEELADPSLMKSIHNDFKTRSERVIPSKNEHIKASIELSVNAIASLNDEDFKKLPPKIQLECMKSPEFQLHTFLHAVAKGKQDDAEKLLTENHKTGTGTGTGTETKAEAKTGLLLKSGTLTDYSGRTFNCTAYEYAYWAKDTHMCRMLEAHMDNETKANMLRRIDLIEKEGLPWQQHGQNHKTPHFDMKPLIDALQAYVDGYPQWNRDSNYNAMTAAWMKVGLAQRDLPVHVVNEYCRPDRSFYLLPAFNEDKLPRELMFNNWNSRRDEPLFPLVISATSGLGVDFSLWRGGAGAAQGWVGACRGLDTQARDLAAVSRLDEVRTTDLTQSREILSASPNIECLKNENLLLYDLYAFF